MINKTRLNNDIEFPCLTFMLNKLIKANKSFSNLFEYEEYQILGVSPKEILELLKFSASMELLKISKLTTFLFSKTLDAVEVEVSYTSYNNDDLVKLCFYEKPGSSLKNKFIYVNRICEDNLSGIAIYDAVNLIILNVNDKYTRYWEPPFNKKENCLGKSLPEIVPGWNKSKEASLWKKSIESGKTLELKEFGYHFNNKGKIYWDYTVTPLYEDGIVKYLIHNSIDVTDRVLDRLHIEEQSRLIAHQNAMLEQTLKEQEEFFSNMSHEFKTPLNVIFSALQVLDLYKNEDPFKESKISKYKIIMKQNCYRLQRLINNLIDISKIDSGYMKLELSNHNIVDIVEDISLSVAEFINNKGLTLTFDTDIEEKFIACNPDMIERIILNLLSNSIKFTDVGGKITVSVLDENSSVKIVVEDTGIGIPEDKLKVIFERFKQVDKSLNRGHEGSGIGLSLVKLLVELHKGTISVTSVEGKGSKFVITLPAHIVDCSSISAKDIVTQDNIERINIEFSDIYALQD